MAITEERMGEMGGSGHRPVPDSQAGQQPPPPGEGVLLPDWMVHTSRVVDVNPYREPKEVETGTFFYNEYTMSDGTAYREMLGQPSQQRTRIPIDGTTAWWTQPEGHNAISDKAFMGLGFVTRRIGAERFPDVNVINPFSLITAIRRGFDVSLAYSAHNNLEILEVSDERNRRLVEPGVSLTAGESRDPMIEPGQNLLGLMRSKKRVITHADSVDPCVGRAVRLGNPLRVLRLLASEGEAAVRTAGHIILSENPLDYRGTVDLRPAATIPAFTLVRGLLGPQAGAMAKLRPKSSPMHLGFMRRSHGNDHEIYEDIYSDHPLVQVVTRDGAHFDIPRTRQGVIRRQARIVDQLRANGDNPFDLDLELVYELPKRPRRGGISLVLAKVFA